MSTFQCTKCNYEMQKEKAPLICPYCGAKGNVKPYKTAQDFLDETMD